MTKVDFQGFEKFVKDAVSFASEMTICKEDPSDEILVHYIFVENINIFLHML